MKWIAALVTGFLFSAPALSRDHIVLGPQGQRYHTGYNPNPNRPTTGVTYYSPKLTGADLPDAYDSRTDGYVPPVRNQGNCGSCWAFAMTRSFEGALLLGNHGVYTDLAEQDWVSHDFSGCGGGDMDASYAVDKGLVKEVDCPYQARTNVSCRSGAEKTKAVRWGYVGARGRGATVEEMKAAIYQYKVVTVDVAAGSGFGDPNSDGVITGCGSRSINHMVTLVGWKKIEGEDYFLVSNSWGTGWGQDGFAWSKLGCNLIGSTEGGALYIVSEEGPAPVPPTVQLPVEMTVTLGAEVAIGVRPQTGVTYSWAPGGETTSTIYVTPTVDTTYTLTATNSAGTATSAVLVKVAQPPIPTP
jgi:hypothetical protein